MKKSREGMILFISDISFDLFLWKRACLQTQTYREARIQLEEVRLLSAKIKQFYFDLV
jgi:hypothetical protein